MSPDQEVKDSMQPLARIVKAGIPPGWGFALFVFPHAEREGTWNYVSDSQREPLVTILKSFIEKSEESWGIDSEEEL